MTLVDNPEVLNLRAMAGDYDYQERHIDLAKLPVLLDNRARGHYAVHLDLASNGADASLQINLTFRADPGNRQMARQCGLSKRALSLGIDRDQLNQTFWLGLGTPGSGAPAAGTPYDPGDEWRTKWSTYDPARANAMLDAIGLTRKDADGFRLRTDNGQRLRLEVDVTRALLPWPEQAEMIAQQWRAIGIEADVKEIERTLFFLRVNNNQQQITMWSNNGSELLFLYPRHTIPVDPIEALTGPDYVAWFVSHGARGTKPTDPALLRIYDLYRGAKTLPQDEQIKAGQEIWRLAVDQQYVIGLVGQSPAFLGVRVVSDRLDNVPERTCIAQQCRTAGGAHPEQFYFK